MNNKLLLEEVEEKYYRLLKEKVYNIKEVNKNKADDELYYIHHYKSSFKFYLAYLMTCYTKTTKGYKSFITYNGFDYCFSYLSNLLDMTAFNIDVDEELGINNSYIKIPPKKYIDAHYMMHQINRLTLNIDINYYHNYKSFLLKYISEYADLYEVVEENNENNRFILVPKDYEVDITKPYDYTCCHDELKEGEIFFEIKYHNYDFSLIRELEKKFGPVELQECIQNYIKNYNENLLYPDLIEELNDKDITNYAYQFNRYLYDYVIKKHIMINQNNTCPHYFVFVDDVIEKFLKNGYSLKQSYLRAKEIEKRSLDFEIYGNTFDDETNLENLINDIEYSDIKNVIFLMFYDICAIEFYFKLVINEYRNKLGSRLDEEEKIFKEKFEKLKSKNNDIHKGYYAYIKKEITQYEKI